MRGVRCLLLSSAAIAGMIATAASAQENTTYSYDVLGRLVKSSISGGPNNNTQTAICFDASGNRVQYTVGSTTPACVSVGTPNSAPTPTPTPTPAPTPTPTPTPAPALWSATLTSGFDTLCDDNSCRDISGYFPAIGLGSISNASFGGNAVVLLKNDAGLIWFSMGGVTAPGNTGWASIYVPGVGLLTRASADYSVSGKYATWVWGSDSRITSGAVSIY